MQRVKFLNLYLLLVVFGTFSLCPQTFSLSENQKNAIIDNCDSIKISLKNIQKKDSYARVYLGGHFETVLSKYFKPLNHRLIENDISNVEIVNEQTNFFNTRTKFSNDFVSYQKTLEDLIGTDCKNSPETFYEKLGVSQTARATVLSDVNELKSIILQNLSSVQLLKEKL